MSKTDENLKSAFAGESQANRKYLAFAARAEEEKKPQVARLFRAAAAAETVHAHNHLKVMAGVRSTVENLAEAIAGESQEWKSMYPEFIAKAKEEKSSQAAWSFTVANKVEEVHHGLYQKALAAVEKGQDLPASDIYVCEVCGNTVEGTPPDKCPICGAPRERFFMVDGGAGAERRVIC
jgi:rubrerythrin